MKYFFCAAALLAGAQAAQGAFNPLPMVYEPGEGTHTQYVRNSMSYTNMGGFMLFIDPDYGGAVEMVEAADGTVWLNYPLSGFAVQGWLTGHIDGDRMTFAMPQQIYDEDGDMYSLVVCVMDQEGEYYYDPSITEVVFNRDRYGVWTSAQLDGDQMFGLVNPYQAFMGVGDFDYSLTPFSIDLPEPPSAIQTGQYAFVERGTGHFVQAALVGNEIWVQGILESAPDVWVKGTLDGSKASFGQQYAGVLEQTGFTPHHAWIMPVVDDRKAESGFAATDAITFDVDADGRMASEGSFVWNCTDDPALISYIGFVQAPQAWPQTGAETDAALTPANPQSVTWAPGMESFSFRLGQLSTDGLLLDPDYYFYRVYIDDEQFIFANDEYVFLDFDTADELPYLYTEGYDIMGSGATREIYLYLVGMERVGVQAVYYGGGKTSVSDIVYSDGTVVSGVERVCAPGLSDGAAAVYDLQGRRRCASALTPGIYVVRTPSGTTRKITVR